MYKKLNSAGFAVAALTLFVVSSVASASPILTSEGKAVAVGTQVSGQSTGEVKLTGSSPVICSSASMKLRITANSGTMIEGEISGGEFVVAGTGSSGDCTSALGAVNMLWNKLCVGTPKGTDNVILTGCESNVTFTTGLTGVGTCKYSTSSLIGNYKTSANATLNFTEGEMKLEEGGMLCPSSQKLDFDLDLTTTEGATLTIS